MTDKFSYPSFVENKAELDRAFGQIATGILSKRVTFLFGAGMSMESDVPGSNGILLELLDEFFPVGSKKPSSERKLTLMREYPFEAIVAAIVKELDKKNRLTEILKTTLLSEAYKPHAGHFDFLTICFWFGQPLIRKIYTTNFDLLIEQAFGDSRATTVTEENAEEIEDSISRGKIPVIHLHGTLDKEYFILEEDVLKEEPTSLQNEFEADLSRKVFVLVGYSMNDPDFRLIYARYQKKIKGSKKTYVVYPGGDEFSYELGQAVWKTRNATWIPLGAKDFFTRLKLQLELHAIEDLREHVKKHRKINDESLDDLIDRVSVALKVDKKEALVFLDQTRIVEGG